MKQLYKVCKMSRSCVKTISDSCKIEELTNMSRFISLKMKVLSHSR